MKYFGTHRQTIKNKAKINFYKAKQKWEIFSEFNKEKRNEKKEFYDWTFNNNLYNSEVTSIPDGAYYTPTSMTIIETCSKDNLISFRNGLVKLMKNHLTNKFSFTSYDQIEDCYNILSNSSIYGHTFYFRGINLENLIYGKPKLYTNKIDIDIINFSSSLFIIKINIFFSKNGTNIFNKIINNDYSGQYRRVSHSFTNRGKILGISSIPKSGAKLNALNQEIIDAKWYILKDLSRFFNFSFFSNNKISPSYIIYKTNLDFDLLDQKDDFKSSIGLHGFIERTSESSLIVMDDITTDSTCNLNFVYNNKTMRLDDLYPEILYQMYSEVKEKYRNFIMIMLVTYIENSTQLLLTDFKKSFTKFKDNRRNYIKLIKQKILFQDKLIEYISLFEELNIEDIRNQAINEFKESKTDKKFYRIYTDNIIPQKENIISQYNSIMKIFSDKLTLSKTHFDYHENKINRNSTFVGLGISAITLFLVIYPEKSEFIKKYIKFLIDFFMTIKN
ncbi:hypothetical protein [Streptococcus dysgalactiae]|uniref:hypothetical protein n=1 Tax=Streptococcus dysgalactiae TaxID=1334 RepID=UPI0010DA8B9E|nr:hypothetical protein [Streptococcus dysgalactiae]VTS19743.1 Uncharacterised protein [Streptococcus dysgalactiae subsp. equisimilis]VTS44959.1 Uncharacterised protein [Streptococcus dysgalactiae subsp. equisimilis]